ncbi:hypothetical protein [Streptomyces sp. NPDC000851]
MEFEGLSPESVSMQHLERYMAAVGAEYAGPYGRPWREGKKPYSQSSLDSAAACLKGFYRFQGTQGIHQELAAMFDRSRLPTKADRRRMFLGHVAQKSRQIRCGQRGGSDAAIRRCSPTGPARR